MEEGWAPSHSVPESSLPPPCHHPVQTGCGMERAKSRARSPRNSMEDDSGKAVNEGIPHAGGEGAGLAFVQLEDALHH